MSSESKLNVHQKKGRESGFPSLWSLILVDKPIRNFNEILLHFREIRPFAAYASDSVIRVSSSPLARFLNIAQLRCIVK